MAVECNFLPNCGRRKELGSRVCDGCGLNYGNKQRARFDPGRVDAFKLAEGLTKRREEEQLSRIPQLSDCPRCSRHSLFYNRSADRFECLNLECLYSFKPTVLGKSMWSDST